MTEPKRNHLGYRIVNTVVIVGFTAVLCGFIYSEPKTKSVMPDAAVSCEIDVYRNTIVCGPNLGDGWFDPRYGTTGEMREINDRWRIGSHTYSTRDLMGRRV